MAHGVSFEQLMLDPGPDFGKTPAQTVEIRGELPDLHALERPVLLAVSRKDFIGAITQRPPRGRAWPERSQRSGTESTPAPMSCASTTSPTSADYLSVRAALTGETQVDSDLRLAMDLRREPGRAVALRHRITLD